MGKKGLVYLKNIPKTTVDAYIKKGIYRFIHPTISGAKKFIIETEIYDPKICILSFYAHGFGEGNAKYQVRLKIGAGEILGLFSACLDAYEHYAPGHALIFSASNDLGKKEEDNKRFSSYQRFLFDRYKSKDKGCLHNGAFVTNTFMMIPPDYSHTREEAMGFYSEFEKRVLEELNNPSPAKP